MEDQWETLGERLSQQDADPGGGQVLIWANIIYGRKMELEGEFVLTSEGYIKKTLLALST